MSPLLIRHTIALMNHKTLYTTVFKSRYNIFSQNTLLRIPLTLKPDVVEDYQYIALAYKSF